MRPARDPTRSRAKPCRGCGRRSRKVRIMIHATGNRMTREIARQSGLADRIDKLQVQVSSGKRLQRASDDAVSWRRIATIGKAQASADAWQTNIASAQEIGRASCRERVCQYG